MFLAVKLKFEEPAALEIIPNAQGWLEPAFPQHCASQSCFKGVLQSNPRHLLCFRGTTLTVSGQDLTFHQASGVTFYGQQYPETRWDMAEGEQTVLKSQKRVMLRFDTKKPPNHHACPKHQFKFLEAHG